MDEIEPIVICQWWAIIAEDRTEFVLLRITFEKRGDLPFSRKSDRMKEKNMVSFMHEQNIICSQTKLDDVGHEQTIICGQLFVGHVVGFLQWMIRIIIHPQEEIIF